MNIIKNDILEIVKEKLDWEIFNNKTILITGSNGMIGKYLCKLFIYLREEKNMNLKLVLLNRSNKTNIKKNFINTINQDVIEPITYEKSIDYIIHAASPTSPLIMKEKPVETFNANVLGTLNCLNLARDKKAKFIFISSREVYGKPIEKEEFKENDLGLIQHFNPRASYSEGKKAAETLCASFNSEYGVDVKVLRLAHTYGPGININDGKVQSDFIKNYLNNENIKLNSDGSSIRTYTYIKDAISGIFYAILKGEDIIYNIANDQEKTTILNLAKTISKIKNKNLKLEFINKEKNVSYSDVKYGILNSKKLTQLGWNASIDIKEGFTRTIDYLEREKNEKN